ncbi:MAG: hypothetical protein A3I07_03110 [Candidatus Doudnabacteria bacterium RIFCSPLOWO2_02_FULL_42_9]|uniref:Response regulatory domain-containing protein n=1 Tax=Candidatus Doudnabacteria bacterium RIFCSPHIGHO2_01_FULL_41_86 TaxID=1817821 RepID=A0A1F5N9C3_9BACT|nr:MAG: hypothetical protein A2717_01500 [Candidatus Doudnabacteria bacterium RIFCSPHIGHO2_01_FULL_41_86]OGE75050.1 MAG: hypothetical protein A3K07_04750 [Candidatus Doudnabacteria bacterium RIFCSPHIGHO2_01_43_10]OGE85243.1 MAG: hypothetical protein A3E28_01070 [Candidatus Doudnabacteria bacterium RIFCSPHIGHO2_12_FULL_42_22]OGE86781.1 MAG: hypothetical protein A3C49_01905 [Candidatus Doudnabacteria bacterium RIFCSPHIGHO2_02_FULL_42_25]OGE92380.1 MAG: hypothetical protein A2895_02060 [Candidatus
MTKKKILVVDDDLVQKDLYLQVFKDKGYDVTGANDGLEGLDIALKFKPDLVFSGIIMPRMDGFEFVRNLRNNAIMAEVPVILFSHLGREEDKKKAEKFTKVTFMIKGLAGPNVILTKVKELLDKKNEKLEDKTT